MLPACPSFIALGMELDQPWASVSLGRSRTLRNCGKLAPRVVVVVAAPARRTWTLVQASLASLFPLPTEGCGLTLDLAPSPPGIVGLLARSETWLPAVSLLVKKGDSISLFIFVYQETPIQRRAPTSQRLLSTYRMLGTVLCP